MMTANIMNVLSMASSFRSNHDFDVCAHLPLFSSSGNLPTGYHHSAIPGIILFLSRHSGCNSI